jgi:hypothetical protein
MKVQVGLRINGKEFGWRTFYSMQEFNEGLEELRGIVLEETEICPKCGGGIETKLRADGLITSCQDCGYVVS